VSVKCYICNSNINEKCGDPADKMNMDARECSASVLQEVADKAQSTLGKVMNIDIPEGQQSQFVCQKIKVSDKEDKTKLIMRGCTILSTVAGDPCSVGIEKLTAGEGKVEYCGTCNEDYCNGSSRQTFTMFLLMVPCFTAIVSHWISI
ncbi:hypothetical protein L9F63_018653, partial [Diploptera punctata]